MEGHIIATSVPTVCQNLPILPYPEELLSRAKHDETQGFLSFSSLTIKYSNNKRWLAEH